MRCQNDGPFHRQIWSWIKIFTNVSSNYSKDMAEIGFTCYQTFKKYGGGLLQFRNCFIPVK